MKLWRTLAVVTTAVVATVACSDTHDASNGTRAIVIDPTVSRASDLSFDSGDRIGVTIIQSGETNPFLANKEFVCNGSVFTAGGTIWYSDISKTADMRAYYPYSAEGEPQTFTVQSNQRNDGYTKSDFMTAASSDIRPTSDAVPMVFRHRMAKINILTTNNSSTLITECGILSCAVTAGVDVAAGTAVPYEMSEKSDITAYETTATTYNAVIPPQSAALKFYVKLDDGSEQRCITMTSTEFESGKQYTATLTITDNNIDVKLSGQIEEWGDNTDLTPDNTQNGNEDNNKGGDSDNDPDGGSQQQGSISWGEVEYPVVTLADGRTWFAANLRYVPAGKSVSDSPNDGNGIWYPCDSDKQALTDESRIAKYGYLYSAATAHGGSTSTGEAAVRGICPEGWHLPTVEEFEALKSAYQTVAELQASAFGFVAGGCISATNAYSYRTQGSLSGEMYLWGSSVNDTGTYCFKATVASSTTYAYESKYHATYGASVRCIKDAE